MLATTAFVPSFLYQHYLSKPRKPGFFQRNAGRRYSIRFHAEHLPNPEWRVRLSQDVDALGLPHFAVDLRYTEADIIPLIRTHECFAQWLTNTGLGTLTWNAPPEERSAYILDQCYDGHHQIGTTRMATTASNGVVDPNCRGFGPSNIFVAVNSVFTTSGEANPTLTAVALAVRLATTIAADAGKLTVPTQKAELQATHAIA